MEIEVIALIGAAAVVFGTGFRLTGVGHPYPTALLTIHKLVALAATVGIGVWAYRAGRLSALSGFEAVAVGGVTALVLALFVTGGVISARHSVPPWIRWLHRFGAWVAAIVVAASVYLTGARR